MTENGNPHILVADDQPDILEALRLLLKGGGYEAVDSMIYYGQPGPFTEDIEETVIGAVRDVMARVGR